MRCCLGIYAKHCNIPNKVIISLCSPQELPISRSKGVIKYITALCKINKTKDTDEIEYSDNNVTKQLINANDTKIGSEIFLKLLSEKLEINKYDLNKMRTHRNEIDLGKCVLPYVKFESKQFNELLTKIKE